MMVFENKAVGNQLLAFSQNQILRTALVTTICVSFGDWIGSRCNEKCLLAKGISLFATYLLMLGFIGSPWVELGRT